MNILLINFYECPENLHLEQAFIRALSVTRSTALDIAHDFRFPYSFIERLPLPGGGVRMRCGAQAQPGRALKERYDSLVVLDFPKRKSCAAQFLRLLRSRAFGRKIFVANHLIPMPGHNPTADIAARLSLLSVFDETVVLEFDDKKLWSGMGAAPAGLRTRGYAVDCGYYSPGGSAGGHVFAAGSAGRDFAVLAHAVKKAGLTLKIFSDAGLPPLSPELRSVVSALPLSRNLHNLRQALREARAVVLPVSNNHINEAAGNSIAFLAMACGRPVIVKRTPYMERFISDGVSGFFYSGLSAASLVRQLNRVLALGPVGVRRLGRAARASVLKRASLDVFARELAVMALGLRASGPRAR